MRPAQCQRQSCWQLVVAAVVLRCLWCAGRIQHAVMGLTQAKLFLANLAEESELNGATHRIIMNMYKTPGKIGQAAVHYHDRALIYSWHLLAFPV